MPYIDFNTRSKWFDEVGELGIYEIRITKDMNKGDLNYVFSQIITNYVWTKGKNYQNLSDAAAALSDCRDEFYRRVIAPYEDEKKEQNGDVFEDIL